MNKQISQRYSIGVIVLWRIRVCVGGMYVTYFVEVVVRGVGVMSVVGRLIIMMMWRRDYIRVCWWIQCWSEFVFCAGLKEEEEQEQTVHEEDSIHGKVVGEEAAPVVSMVDDGWWREWICDGFAISTNSQHDASNTPRGRQQAGEDRVESIGRKA